MENKAYSIETLKKALKFTKDPELIRQIKMKLKALRSEKTVMK